MTHLRCGKPAFLMAEEALEPGRFVEAKDVQHLDGRPALSGELARCDSCGRQVEFSFEDLWPE